MEIVETDGKDGHIYRVKKIDEIQEIKIAERDKRNEFCIKYKRGVNIIGGIDNGLGVTAIVLGITTSLNNRCCTSRKWNGSSINLLWDYFDL